MTFTTWFTLFSIALLGAMSPGPSLAVIIKNTLSGGKLHGIATAWAHAIGIIGYACLTVFGLAFILKQNPLVFESISILGAAYLAWLGCKALTSKGGIADKLAQGKQQSYYASMRNGLMISMLNPKIGLFFIALFSQFLHADAGFSEKMLTLITPPLTDGSWYTLVVLVLSRPKVLNKLREKAQIIDKITGCVLIAIALRILFTL